jgi:glycosyltransferase involved in cell wall biosynthesis
MFNNHSITALVPVYNEIAIVRDSVREIHDFLHSLGHPFEILIIESGSSDGTAEACDALALHLPRTVVVHEGKRNGFGAALRLGFSKATSDLIWIIPVDLPYSLSVVKEALRQIVNCDAIISIRRSDKRNILRRLQSRVYTLLCRLLLGQPAHSPNAAFKLYRASLLRELPLCSNGWFIDTEIIYRLRERNCRLGIVQIDTSDRTNRQSTVKPMDSLRMLKQLLAFRKMVIDENRHRKAA